MLPATLICASAGALPQLNRANFIRGGAALLGAPIVGYEIYSRVPPLSDPSDALPPLPAITASSESAPASTMRNIPYHFRRSTPAERH